MVTLCLIFVKLPYCPLWWLLHFTSPSAKHKGLGFSTSSWTLVIFVVSPPPRAITTTIGIRGYLGFFLTERRSVYRLAFILWSLFLYLLHAYLQRSWDWLPIYILPWLLNDTCHLTKVGLAELTGFSQDLFALPWGAPGQGPSPSWAQHVLMHLCTDSLASKKQSKYMYFSAGDITWRQDNC